jgi:hypothetical protein
MITDIIITVVVALIGALGGVVVKYVVPWLSARTDAETLTLMASIVESVVRAAYAEGVKRGWSGDDQKAWAIAQAKKVFDIDLTEAQYDLIRKSVVQQVKAIGDGATAAAKV